MIKRRISFSLFFLLFLFAGILAAMISQNGIAPAFSRHNSFKVVLDAGHGAPDGGAVGASGTEEKDINLDIVLKLQEILESRGTTVILTRSGDNGIYESTAQTIHEMKVSDMHNRRDIVNNSGADLFLSIHMNAFGSSSAGGLHVFYARNHPEAEETAKRIQECIASLTGAKPHAVKTASDSLFLMKDPVPPAVLVECGFITNPDEERLLNTEEYRAKIAFAIANAISE